MLPFSSIRGRITLLYRIPLWEKIYGHYNHYIPDHFVGGGTDLPDHGTIENRRSPRCAEAQLGGFRQGADDCENAPASFHCGPQVRTTDNGLRQPHPAKRIPLSRLRQQARPLRKTMSGLRTGIPYEGSQLI